jgi:probable HAF family extracellular repeat protein
MTDLGSLSATGPSQAYGINNRGQIVGAAVNAAGFVHGVLWDNGQINDLGLLPTGLVSSAFGINNAGLVVGSANTSRSGGANRDNHASLWTVQP